MGDRTRTCIKRLANHFYQFCFSILYDEPVPFKESVTEHAKDTMLEKQEDQGLAQWTADKVDRNIITLTSKGTFHGMGLISMHSSGFICSNSVPRLKGRNETSSIIQNKGINILQFIGSSENGL